MAQMKKLAKRRQDDPSVRIVMLLSNPFRPDPRVAREAVALAENDYHVSVICWDRQAELLERELYNGVEIIRVQNVISAYSSGWQQFFYLPRFWEKAFSLAVTLRPHVVHCHDLDTLFAGWRIKKRLKCTLVYDAHEHYPALMSLYLPRLFVKALVGWENLLLPYADAIITASPILGREFAARGCSRVVSVGNYPDLSPYARVTQAEVETLRSELGLSRDDLMVAYIGGFSRNRMLLSLIRTGGRLTRDYFHIWGDGPQRSTVEQAVARYPNVSYHGWLEPVDLPRYFKAADIIYYCLRLDYPGAIYNAPNTLFQAMAAGRPIIANDVGVLGRVIREAQCGLLINEVTSSAIASAIDKLRNPAVHDQLGSNALSAAKSTYNAAFVRRQLLELYRELVL